MTVASKPLKLRVLADSYVKHGEMTPALKNIIGRPIPKTFGNVTYSYKDTPLILASKSHFYLNYLQTYHPRHRLFETYNAVFFPLFFVWAFSMLFANIIWYFYYHPHSVTQQRWFSPRKAEHNETHYVAPTLEKFYGFFFQYVRDHSRGEIIDNQEVDMPFGDTPIAQSLGENCRHSLPVRVHDLKIPNLDEHRKPPLPYLNPRQYNSPWKDPDIREPVPKDMQRPRAIDWIINAPMTDPYAQFNKRLLT